MTAQLPESMSSIEIISTIDTALNGLLCRERIKYYEIVRDTYKSKMCKYTTPGFEAVLRAFLFCDQLTTHGDNVFIEWPVKRNRIDIRLDSDPIIYLYELKMYQSRDNKEYKTEFDKLEAAVKEDKKATTVGVHAQVQIYLNRKFPAHEFLRNKESEMLSSSSAYCANYDELYTDEHKKRDTIHIVRLVFWKKSMSDNQTREESNGQ